MKMYWQVLFSIILIKGPTHIEKFHLPYYNQEMTSDILMEYVVCIKYTVNKTSTNFEVLGNSVFL
jgi:hypothetical protein